MLCEVANQGKELELEANFYLLKKITITLTKFQTKIKVDLI